MALLRRLIAGPPALNRHALSKEFCRRIGWFKPDGGLKDMMARVTMLAMHSDGLIVLPPPKWRQKRPGPIVFGQDTEPPLFPPPTILDEVRPLELRTVVGGTRQGRLWNEFVARHHYLGYKTLVGAQMRYAVHDRNGWPLAILGFSTAAWSLAPRDRFIGWTPTLRKKNLPLVIDNPRFLILPWIRIPNLGSHILALVRRRLPRDWTRRYNTTPVLIETFVEVPRFTGGVYRASGLDPRRYHTGTRALRHRQAVRQAHQGCLAPPARQALEAHPQPLSTPTHTIRQHDAPHGLAEQLPTIMGGITVGKGVLGEYVWRALDEAKQRPRFVQRW